MRNLFTRRAAPGRAGMIKGLVTGHLGLTEGDLVSIAELACHEPGCPPVETVVTVRRADGARRDWRVHKALAEIEEADVQKALVAEGGRF